MGKIRNALTNLWPSRWGRRRRQCAGAPSERSAAPPPQPTEPSLPNIADIISDRQAAEELVEHGNPIAATIRTDRARRAGIQLAAHWWRRHCPVIQMAESVARHYRLEVIGDRLPDETVLARVPTLRIALEMYRLRWCCDHNLISGVGAEHECHPNLITPLRRTRRPQNYRTVHDLFMHADRCGVCLECGGVCAGAECPMALAVEDYDGHLPDDLNPGIAAISQLPH